MTNTEAQAALDNGQRVYVLYSQAYVVALEPVTEQLCRVTLSSGDVGLHSYGNLTTKETTRRARKTGMRALVSALQPR